MKHLSLLLFSAALFFGGTAFAEETPAPQPEILKVTSDYKPEIFSFDFHMPRLNNPELVNAADFGLSAKSTPEENALAIEKIANYLQGNFCTSPAAKILLWRATPRASSLTKWKKLCRAAKRVHRPGM